MAVTALAVGQWLGNIDAEAPTRAVAETNAASGGVPSLRERAGRDLRANRPPPTGQPSRPTSETRDPMAPEGVAEPSGHDILNVEYFRTALQGLTAQGADLNQPMPSRHVVATRSLVAAQRMVLWGRQQGYHVEPMETAVADNGEALYNVPLVKVSVPQAESILADAQRIAAFAASQGELSYRAWAGAVVRRP